MITLFCYLSNQNSLLLQATWHVHANLFFMYIRAMPISNPLFYSYLIKIYIIQCIAYSLIVHVTCTFYYEDDECKEMSICFHYAMILFFKLAQGVQEQSPN